MQAKRWWVAECQYNNGKPFIFGNFEAAGIEDAMQEFIKLWTSTFPGLERGVVVHDLVPGQLVYVEEKDNKR